MPVLWMAGANIMRSGSRAGFVCGLTCGPVFPFRSGTVEEKTPVLIPPGAIPANLRDFARKGKEPDCLPHSF
nr:hypothetical protein [Bacillaceae bacterium]